MKPCGGRVAHLFDHVHYKMLITRIELTHMLCRSENRENKTTAKLYCGTIAHTHTIRMRAGGEGEQKKKKLNGKMRRNKKGIGCCSILLAGKCIISMERKQTRRTITRSSSSIRLQWSMVKFIVCSQSQTSDTHSVWCVCVYHGERKDVIEHQKGSFLELRWIKTS